MSRRPPENTPQIAIVDYNVGNLASIMFACGHAGMTPVLTSDAAELMASDAVLLPGVGAFKTAMDSLRKLGLLAALRDVVAMRKPLIGICLGMQLLMTESEEFGTCPGLGFVSGTVRRLQQQHLGGRRWRVPHVGWNQLLWNTPRPSLFADLPPEASYYFTHSYHVMPENPAVVVAFTLHGADRFCSALLADNIFACQFHPERSGPMGLRIYENIAAWVQTNTINGEREYAIARDN